MFLVVLRSSVFSSLDFINDSCANANVPHQTQLIGSTEKDQLYGGVYEVYRLLQNVYGGRSSAVKRYEMIGVLCVKSDTRTHMFVC